MVEIQNTLDIKESDNLNNSESWSLNSWRTKKINQQPVYENYEDVTQVLNIIGNLNKTITSFKAVDQLQEELAEDNFVLIAGDCAESFVDNDRSIINMKCAFLEYLAYNLNLRFGKKVVILGRMAGQFAKPRSSDTEVLNQGKILFLVTYKSFRGDIVNSFDLKNRKPDPYRLKLAFDVSTDMKRYINEWNENKIFKDQEAFSVVEDTDFYKFLLQNIKNFKLIFDRYSSDSRTEIVNTQIYTCHEALILDYETSLTKKKENEYYNLNSEFIWIGERTNNIDEAHIEYFRGLKNPVGIKVGTKTTPEVLQKTLSILNPKNLKGKVLVITRVGNNEKGRDHLDKIFASLKGYECTIICDPMHGNTETLNGYKTRLVRNLIEEVNFTKDLLEKHGLKLGGIHLESTPFDVTECISTKEKVEIEGEKYLTLCDPRLNFTQCLDLISGMK